MLGKLKFWKKDEFGGDDPFGSDPFGKDDPFASKNADPFADKSTASNKPSFSQEQFGGADPFATEQSHTADPFAAASPRQNDPFGSPLTQQTNTGFSSSPANQNFPPQQQQQYARPPPVQHNFEDTRGFAPQSVQTAPPMQSTNRDMDLVLAKLDTLKTMLDNVNRRLEMLEEYAKGEHPAQKTRYTW